MRTLKSIIVIVLAMQLATNVFAQKPFKKVNFNEQSSSNAFIEVKSKQNSKMELDVCPPNAIWGQGPGGGAYTSAKFPGYKAFQAFVGIKDTIYGIHFWGLLLFHDGKKWNECFSNALNLEIQFYNNDNNKNKPGTMTDEFKVVVSPQQTKVMFADIFPMYEFTVFFDKPVYKEIGWVSYQSLDSSCWLLPITSDAPFVLGNSYQYDENKQQYNLQRPLACCFLGNPGSCPYPIGLKATTEDTFANLFWEKVGTPSEWEIEWGLKGFTKGSGTVVKNISTNSFKLENLTPYTSYEYYVRSMCNGDSSFWVGPYDFTTTGCPKVNQCEFSFEMFSTWFFGGSWGDAMVNVYEDDHLITSVSLYSGNSQTVKVPLCDKAKVRFEWISGVFDQYCALTIKDPLGLIIYSFETGKSPADSTVFLSFTVDCNPKCPQPVNLYYDNSTLTTADIGWKPLGKETSWEVEYGFLGFDKGTGFKVIANKNPFTLTNLTSATIYEFYVRAVCGSDTSKWVGPQYFTTDCPPVTFYPYNEKFTGPIFPPLCWKNIDADGDGYSWIRYANDAQAGLYCAASASWVDDIIGAVKPDNFLMTRKFKIPNNKMVLSYWIAAQDKDFAKENYSVMISTKDRNLNNFVTIFSETLENDVWKNVILPLTDYANQEIYIAFRHHNVTDMFYIKLDNVSILNTTDVDNISIVPSMNLYPNPTTDLIFISHTADVEIYNMLGQKVKSEKNTNKVDVTELNPGLYIVKAFVDNKITVSKIEIIR